MRHVRHLAAASLLAALALGAAAPGARAEAVELGAYPLDALARSVPPKGKMVCPKVDLVTYRGDVVRYSHALTVTPPFVERLRRFEAVAAEVGARLFGRPPKSIRHMGGFYCRRIARYPDLLSEHGIGNAIDVTSFAFAPLPKGAAAPAELPRRFRRGFDVVLARDWDEDPEATALTARFLRELTEALVARDDIFRVLLGPAYPGHKDHFHFDVAPYRLVVL